MFALLGLVLVASQKPSSGQGWPQRYTGAGGVEKLTGMVIDPLGNVIVTGMSYRNDQTRLDYATVKYNSAGERQWVRIYSGPEHPIEDLNLNQLYRNADVPAAIACDSRSNVYVTGYSCDNKRDRLGAMLNVVATVKYEPNGRQAWVQRYSPPADCGYYPHSVAVDNMGNTYIVGDVWEGMRRNHLSGPTGWFVLKYDTNGSKKWVQSARSGFRPQTVRMGPAGQVWIAGITDAGGDRNAEIAGKQFPTRRTSFVSIALDSDGNRKLTLGSIDARSQVFRFDVQLDAHGNLYGRTLDADWKVHLSKYEPSGARQWSIPIADYPDGVDQAFAVDMHGAIYLPRRLGSDGSNLQKVELTAFAPDGKPRGTQSVSYSDAHWGFVSAQLAFDVFGHVFVAGTSAYTSNASDDYLVLRFDTND